ncbi:MAG TPA: hypothetical protein PLO07_07890, partial [Rubrivivax sp.]|nr:hypothetical protein [Rubrivivax sp.]
MTWRPALVLLWLASCLAMPAGAQTATPAPAATATSASTGPGDSGLAIAPGDIPSRADADEKFLLAVQRRIQLDEPLRRIEQSLSHQAQALDRLDERTDRNDLSQLSVQRLESLERHWQLKERTLAQTRAELMAMTNAASEDAAELAARRAAWQATRTQPYLSPALVERSDELIANIDRAQAALAKPLANGLPIGAILMI